MEWLRHASLSCVASLGRLSTSDTRLLGIGAHQGRLQGRSQKRFTTCRLALDNMGLCRFCLAGVCMGKC